MQEAYKPSERGLIREIVEQYNLRNTNRRGYDFPINDVKEMYDELLKHGKIQFLVSRRPEEAGMTKHHDIVVIINLSLTQHETALL